MVAIVAAGVVLGYPSPPILVSVVLLAALIGLCWFDVRYMILPDALTFPLILAGFWWTWWTDGSWTLSLVGAAIGYCLVRVVNLLWQARRGTDGMGLGDGKLLAATGAWLGAFALAPVLLIASATALLSILIVTQGRPEARLTIPFGPFIALGFWCAWILPIVPEV